jgi:hypothetical protein
LGTYNVGEKTKMFRKDKFSRAGGITCNTWSNTQFLEFVHVKYAIFSIPNFLDIQQDYRVFHSLVSEFPNLPFKLDPGSILGRTSTQGLKIIEGKQLPLQLTSVNGC